ncbi:LptA/OstA family protein [Oricola cellulosilytica]|uniref:LPS ABC transporter substrate-binding protein LptA n=1 Tax=Oricola cellulosilytica TaxID=1429082 RepID=A0A4R0PHQ8_9HYPH|nr:LptA/OstA family protein [Oricola cellulosilytica]TCD16314.1 LPS ABC transporter substrate-binding protein LptA [Oricola cellulosilytica]
MRKASTVRGAANVALVIALGLMTTVVPAGAQSGGRDTGLQLTGDQPVQIEGDELEVLEDQGRAVFTGNVRVVQGPTILRTGKLVIHYATDGSAGSSSSITSGASQIERLEATGGVNIQSEKQVATGDRGVYDMGTEVLELTGKRVTLSEDGNVATGCKLTVAMKTGRAKLEGCGSGGARPTILLQPRSKTGN